MRLQRGGSSKKERSVKSERKLAAIVGGKVQPASGAINAMRLKGDVASTEFLLDDKTTIHASFGVSQAVFAKLAKEAWRLRRKPAISVNFEQTKTRLFVISESDFRHFIRLLQEEAANG